MDETKNRYYLEFELHLEEPMTQQELAQLCDEFVEFTKKWKCWPPKCSVVKDPKYDSFGNLWE